MTDHYSVRKLWLIFAQTATICLAILFVVSTLRPLSRVVGQPRPAGDHPA
ncbi:MAG: hypothetical protein U1E63_00435 [Burkholderiales bacterium]